MLDTLRRIVQEVNNAPDIPSALDLMAKRVRDAMGTEVCSIYLRNNSEERYVLMASEGLKREAIGRVSLGLSEGLVGQVGLREEPINLEDAFSHNATISEFRSPNGKNIITAIAVITCVYSFYQSTSRVVLVPMGYCR